jgi:DNA-binding response OmpR family regulator
MKILWVDDDVFFMTKLVGHVRDAGYDVILAEGPDEALALFRENYQEIGLVVLDIMMPHGRELNAVETMAGYATGLALARKIREELHAMPLLALSVVTDHETMDWFRKNTAGYLVKPVSPGEVVRMITKALGQSKTDKQDCPKAFIVHGHDEVVLLELKNYLQNTLRFPEPIILREQPSQGRTIIEKFEEAAADVDLVFVLLTPDDQVITADGKSDQRRARQNVILELGFFLAHFQRRSGKVILLHKGALDIPSDLEGVVYVDISAGIDAAGERLRRELGPWL